MLSTPQLVEIKQAFAQFGALRRRPPRPPGDHAAPRRTSR